MHPVITRKVTPRRILDLLFDPAVPDVFRGSRLNFALTQILQRIVNDPFALCGHLEEKLVVGTRRDGCKFMRSLLLLNGSPRWCFLL
jgi:hypothetical protein